MAQLSFIRRVFLAIVFLMALGQVTPASAATGPAPILNGGTLPATTITGYALTCSSVTISGRASSTWLAVYINNTQTYAHYRVGPGSFTVTLSFPTQSTSISFSDWSGTANVAIGASGYWDGHGWSQVDNAPCPSSWGTIGAKPVLKYNFMDGRCNQEPWQSFAIYPDGKGGWIFYALYNSVGYYAMHVTKAFMDAHPDTGVNHIIVQMDGIQLYRLAGGLLQAHRIGLNGKDYYFNLDHCYGATAPTFAPPVPNTY